MSERDSIRERNASISLSRRAWLEVAAAAGLGLAAPSIVRAAAEPELRARARKNLKLGIMSNVYAELPVEEAARQIKADGFSLVVTDFAFADVHFNPLEPDWAAAKKIVATLERAGIEIVGLFGYYNIVDPDVKRRKLGEARMEALLTNGKRLGCRWSRPRRGPSTPSRSGRDAPENQTEEGYLQCKAALQKHARTAEKHGAVLSIEAYYRNIIGTIDRAERLFREVHSPALRLVMDPCNFFRKEDLPRMKPMLEAMFQRLGDQIVIAHAKDVKPSPDGEDLPAAGLGVLDYPALPPPPGPARPPAPPGRRAPAAARRGPGAGLRARSDRADLTIVSWDKIPILSHEAKTTAESARYTCSPARRSPPRPAWTRSGSPEIDGSCRAFLFPGSDDAGPLGAGLERAGDVQDPAPGFGRSKCGCHRSRSRRRTRG